MPDDNRHVTTVKKRGRSRKLWIHNSFDEEGGCIYCHRLVTSPNISVKKVRCRAGRRRHVRMRQQQHFYSLFRILLNPTRRPRSPSIQKQMPCHPAPPRPAPPYPPQSPCMQQKHLSNPAACSYPP